MNEQTRDATVGFIGLGMMGAHMAANIMRRGKPLVVHDVVAAKAAGLAAAGAHVAANPGEVAAQARIIVVMVDTADQVEEVLFGPKGSARFAQAGDQVICMSTIGPEAARGFAHRLAEIGVGMLDAPVSGMEQGARDGTLRAFVGGTEQDLSACRPVLEAMASTIIHFGPSGQGLVMKLVNNMLVQVGWVAIAEALTLGTKAGLNPRQMVEVLGLSSGNSAALQYMAPRWLDRDFDGIRLDITHKDMQQQIDLARSVGVPMFMAPVAQQIYQLARCSGLGGEDGVAVVKVYEAMAGISPG